MKKGGRGEGQGGGVRKEPPKAAWLPVLVTLIQDLSEHRVGELILGALLDLISCREGGNGLFAPGLNLLYFPYVE